MFLEFFAVSSIEQNRQISPKIVAFNPTNPIKTINDLSNGEISAKQKTAKLPSLLELQRFLIPQIPQIPHLIVDYGVEQIRHNGYIGYLIVDMGANKIRQIRQIRHLIVDYGERKFDKFDKFDK